MNNISFAGIKNQFNLMYQSSVELIKTSFTNSPLEETKDNLFEIKLSLLDPTIRENALKILNLSEEDTRDFDKVTQIYLNLTQTLENRKSKVSSVFADAIEILIMNVNQAYETIKKS